MSTPNKEIEMALAQIAEALKNGTLSVGSDETASGLSDDPKLASSAKFAKLPPTARQDYANKQLVDQLREECQNLRTQLATQSAEFRALRHKELENERLRHSLRGSRWIGAVCAISMVVGGGLVSSFATSTMGFGIGWGLIIVAGMVQLGRSVLDW